MTDERDLLAAESALRLLDGRELEEARALAERDPGFAILVDQWDQRFAPLFDEIESVEPDAAVWRRIRAAIGRGNGEGEVIALRRKVTMWRSAALASALAAAFALVLVMVPSLVRPDRAPVPVPVERAAPTMMAKVIAKDRSTAFVVAYEATSRDAMVTPAMAAAPEGHAHELWLIPASGIPMSLGMVDDELPTRLAISPDMAPHMLPQAMLAVTVEPAGGSPTGQPTSAPVATGPLARI